MDLIFTHGREFTHIARAYGFKTGANQGSVKNMNKEYVDFLDNDFRKPNYEDLISKIKEFQPEYLVLADIYDNTNIQEVQDKIIEVRNINKDIKIILAIKTSKYLNEFDNDIIYGIPIPSSFGDKDSFDILSILDKISNRKLHLLGGDIYKQFEIYDLCKKNNNDIISTDSNYAANLANRGIFYDWRNGKNFSTFKEFKMPEYWRDINIIALSFSLLIWKNLWNEKLNNKKNAQTYFG